MGRDSLRLMLDHPVSHRALAHVSPSSNTSRFVQIHPTFIDISADDEQHSSPKLCYPKEILLYLHQPHSNRKGDVGGDGINNGN